MEITDLTDEQMNIILTNYGRQCPNCKIRMQPLSTMCTGCGQRNPLEKIKRDNYVEHFEIANCKKHGSTIHLCCHPKINSSIMEVFTLCIKCIIQVQVKTGVEIIESEKSKD